MRAIIIFFLFFQINLYSQIIEDESQVIECSVFFEPKDTVYLPHFGQNEVLYSILDITMKNYRGSTVGTYSDNIPFHVPVKIWLYRNDNGSKPALSESDAYMLFNEVNRHYAENNTGIQFYLKCGIEYVNSTKGNSEKP